MNPFKFPLVNTLPNPYPLNPRAIDKISFSPYLEHERWQTLTNTQPNPPGTSHQYTRTRTRDIQAPIAFVLRRRASSGGPRFPVCAPFAPCALRPTPLPPFPFAFVYFSTRKTSDHFPAVTSSSRGMKDTTPNPTSSRSMFVVGSVGGWGESLYQGFYRFQCNGKMQQKSKNTKCLCVRVCVCDHNHHQPGRAASSLFYCLLMPY